MPETRFLTEQTGRVLTVEFNNPPRNFFDERMSIELDDLTRQLERDASIGAVVFTGRDTYLTHFNVPDLLRGSRLAPFPISHGQARIAMNRMDKVFVTAINGLALGMGCIFALACDIRLMADGEHPIGLVETGIAMLAGAGGTQRLARMLGSARALELLLEGRWLMPSEAAEIGLVHRVVAPDQLQDQARATAERLARRSPMINRMVYDAGTRSFSAGTRMEAASLMATVSSPEAERSMDAYVREIEEHDPLTDDAICNAWLPLFENGVPPA